jgi:hypothetical protein
MKFQTNLCAAISGLFCLAFVPAQAQRVELVSGSLAFLKDATALRIKYVYDGMFVGKTNEPDYIKYKVADWNAKEPGKGDKWLANWVNDRAGRYEPAFEAQFTKHLNRKSISFIRLGNDVKYTMVLKTLETEPGWAGWGLIHNASHIDAVVTFVETAQPETVLATISVREAEGNGFDYDPAGRIENAYATCGKALGAYLNRAMEHLPSVSSATTDFSAVFATSDTGELVRNLKKFRSPEYAAAAPAILPLLNNKNAGVVRDACRTLAVIANKDVIPSIEPLLQDKRSAVRKDAQDAINLLRQKP